MGARIVVLPDGTTAFVLGDLVRDSGGESPGATAMLRREEDLDNSGDL